MPLVLAALLLALATAPVARAAAPGPPEVVATGLATPWEVVLVPDGRTWVTERPCRVREVGAGGALRTIFPAASRPGCTKFLGMALHPRFAENRLVYLYETATAGSRILRLREEGGVLVEEAVVLSGIRTDRSHDGGRMRFGPDGHLYVTTGDVHDPAAPQDLGSLNGKVLRLAAPGGAGDGAPAPGNPFAGTAGARAEVWSYGHRHPQGLAFDGAGRLWSSEHGPTGEGHAPAGADRGRDEVNLVVPGGNYGWPLVVGDQTREGTVAPAAHSGTATWAPGGAAIADDGALYVPNLAGQHLRRFAVSCSGLGAQSAALADQGRLRTATSGRGALWITTDAGSSSRLLRLPVDPEGFAGLTCGPPAGSRPPDAPPASAGGPPPPEAARAAAIARRLDALLARARDGLRSRGALQLARRGGLAVRAGGFDPGTLRVRVTRRLAGGRTATVALRIQRVRGRGAQLVRLVATPAGARVLRRAGRRPRLGLLARHTPAAAPAVERAARVRVRR